MAGFGLQRDVEQGPVERSLQLANAVYSVLAAAEGARVGAAAQAAAGRGNASGHAGGALTIQQLPGNYANALRLVVSPL